MSDVVATPVKTLENVANFRLPLRADERLQELMDRNTEGLLSPEERKELATLAELSETISLLRAEAMQVLGRRPQ